VSTPPISNVSDTARWAAVYRARESARPDALFKDPYAEQLAGERGRAIAALMPRQARNGWPLIARTQLLDDLVLQAIVGGCDCVLNLAAGLDMRPYRLDLPASLRWIEADLPPLIDEKARLLANAQPRCRLERVRVDLIDAAARVAMLREAVGSSTQALVITEGFLLYLDEGEVRALAGSSRRGGHSMVVARSGVAGNSQDDAPAHGRTACKRADEIRAAQRGRLLRGARLAGRLRAVPAARSRAIQALALALPDIRAFTGDRSAESRPGALVRRRRAPAITHAIHARPDLRLRVWGFFRAWIPTLGGACSRKPLSPRTRRPPSCSRP